MEKRENKKIKQGGPHIDVCMKSAPTCKGEGIWGKGQGWKRSAPLFLSSTPFVMKRKHPSTTERRSSEHITTIQRHAQADYIHGACNTLQHCSSSIHELIRRQKSLTVYDIHHA